MSDDALAPLVAESYTALADVLDGLAVSGWDTPSLCEGWRVREVVAHLTMPARYDEESFMAELEADGFDFTKLSNRIASRDAALSTDELVANLRSEVLQRWTPPGGGYHGALNHVVIHGLDVTVPLGAPRTASDDALRVVLDDLTAGGGHEHFGVAIEGRTLRATDLDWSHGSGPEVSGAAEDLALAACGRTLPPGRLHGEPLARGE
ncbi:MAG TPA: maleylpyruvate isomerase family mycothiol-dependent enzyme [Acidimicrobiia bacterium]|jgi:uncharacterized protein (TIGR03083 family)